MINPLTEVLPRTRSPQYSRQNDLSKALKLLFNWTLCCLTVGRTDSAEVKPAAPCYTITAASFQDRTTQSCNTSTRKRTHNRRRSKHLKICKLLKTSGHWTFGLEKSFVKALYRPEDSTDFVIINSVLISRKSSQKKWMYTTFTGWSSAQYWETQSESTIKYILRTVPCWIGTKTFSASSSHYLRIYQNTRYKTQSSHCCTLSGFTTIRYWKVAKVSISAT